MITFYVDAFRSMGGWAWHARVWAHRHPRWARTIATFALIGYFTFIQGQTPPQALPCIDMAVRQMRPGGYAFVTATAKFAYGCPSYVPPSS